MMGRRTFGLLLAAVFALLGGDALPSRLGRVHYEQEQWLQERLADGRNHDLEIGRGGPDFLGERHKHFEKLRDITGHHEHEHGGDGVESPGVYVEMGDTPESAEIVSAGMPEDTSGKDIHAHGGGIYVENGTYYWFGTSQKVLPGNLSAGINVYQSTDLQHWEFGGMIFKNTSITVPLAPGKLYRIERPKVIYNKKTETYVMYFHLDDSSFGLKMVGLATSKSVMGEYQFIAGWKPDGEDSYDMSLFYDDPSDEAYLVRSVRNQFAGISKLTDDFLNTTGITSQGPRLEGQAIFRCNGKYYLLGSHLTGWAANPAVLAVADKADTLVGAKWTVLGNPTGSAKTWNSQSTFVLSYTHPSGKVLNIFMADRWKAPDVKDADYLWLPFVNHGSTLNITHVDEWKVKDY